MVIKRFLCELSIVAQVAMTQPDVICICESWYKFLRKMVFFFNLDVCRLQERKDGNDN